MKNSIKFITLGVGLGLIFDGYFGYDAPISYLPMSVGLIMVGKAVLEFYNDYSAPLANPGPKE